MSGLRIDDAERLAGIIATAIKGAVTPLKQRIEALEARPAAGGEKWCKHVAAGERYEPGSSLVTRSGSLWLLTAMPNGDPPGQDPSWRLVVKKGDYSRRGGDE
jgi:hypothetical protein